MNKYGVFSILLAISGVQQVNAAEQSVPAQTTFTIAADASLKAKLPQEVIQRGYIIAGTNPNTPPTTFYQEDNKTLAGREIDIMTAVAERLGVKVQWHDTGGFDNIIPGLKSGRYDVALANINATQKRTGAGGFRQLLRCVPPWHYLPSGCKHSRLYRTDAGVRQRDWRRCGHHANQPSERRQQSVKHRVKRRLKSPSSRTVRQAYRRWSAGAYRCSLAPMKA